MSRWVRANFDSNSATLTNAYVDIDAYPLVHVVSVTSGVWEIEVNNLNSVVFRLHGTWSSEAAASEALQKLLQGYSILP